ncbi:MAG TPA: cytochrome c oxidase subunit II [Steroidobacteraceae bacterium]|jgi:cytochrome c oxidase subunit 2
MSLSAHSVSQPLGVHAEHIAFIWHAMLGACGLMYALLLGFLVMTLLRQHRSAPAGVELEKRIERTLILWVGLIVVGLCGLTLASFLTDRALVRAASEPQIALRVIGHQWWWQVEYVDADNSQNVRTANEIHLPVGAQVHIALSSDDVIHSFWVPNLNGKRDLIPGRSTEIRLQPLTTGRFRGFCAEFCGVQHAYMQFEVIVESAQEFAAWKARQLAGAVTPTDPLRQAGRDVFERAACPLCHAIAGTNAAASTGPDLSHFASRRLLAAGALTNTRDHLRAWLQNPQRVKPGNHMPVVDLPGRDMTALVAYLGSLQ